MMNLKLLVVMLSVVAVSGCCASREYVDQQDAMLGDRIGKLETRVAGDEAKMNEIGSKVDALGSDVAAAKADAAAAAKKADDAQACCNANAEKIKKLFEQSLKK
jgi:outer membrane murein-binding lipoprotein Lpp